MNIYTIYDRLSKDAGPLFVQKTDASAVRATVAMMVEARKTIFDAEEYDLRCVGTIDTETCVITTENCPYNVSYLRDLTTAYMQKADNEAAESEAEC